MSAYRYRQAQRFSEFIAGRQSSFTDRLFQQALANLLKSAAPRRPGNVGRVRMPTRATTLGSRGS